MAFSTAWTLDQIDTWLSEYRQSITEVNKTTRRVIASTNARVTRNRLISEQAQKRIGRLFAQADTLQRVYDQVDRLHADHAVIMDSNRRHVTDSRAKIADSLVRINQAGMGGFSHAMNGRIHERELQEESIRCAVAEAKRLQDTFANNREYDLIQAVIGVLPVAVRREIETGVYNGLNKLGLVDAGAQGYASRPTVLKVV